MTNLNFTEEIDPTRTIYVLIHVNHTHVLPEPGNPNMAWHTYDKDQASIVRRSLVKDFKNKEFVITTLAKATALIGNKQDELMQLWKTPMNLIRSAQTLEEKFSIYRKAKKAFKAHPLLLDNELKQHLKIQ